MMRSGPSAAPRWVVASAALAIVAAALLVAACGNDDSPAPVISRPVAAEAERQRDSEGAALLVSIVRVAFEAEVELALDGDELLEAIRIQTPGGRPRQVPVRSVSLDEDDASRVLIETAELVPNGSELRIQRAALSRGGEGSVATRIESDLTPIQVTLASRPVAPTRPELFAASSVPPVTDQDRDEAILRRQLADHLELRGTTGDLLDRAIETYDQMPAELVPSPKLRAALAGLTGSFAEGAIFDLLTEANCTGQPVERIAFEEPPDFPTLLARVTYTDTGARVVSVHPNLEGEPFQLLMPILMHEAIHCDRVAELDEEIAATALDTFFYIFLLAAEPWLAQEGTTLSHNFNVDALAMINSGRIWPESIGVLASPGGHPVFPGTESEHRSFADYIRAAYSQLDPGPSPEEPLAQEYVANLASLHDLPVRNAFNAAYLDGLLGFTMEPAVMMAAMAALGLEPVP